MTHWPQILRVSDPGMERMDADAAARMRELIVRTARTPAPSPSAWPMRLALAAFACVVLMLSVLATRPAPDMTGGSPAVAGSERRQIQFATPGGTRIIWEINPDFTLGDTIP